MISLKSEKAPARSQIKALKAKRWVLGLILTFGTGPFIYFVILGHQNFLVV